MRQPPSPLLLSARKRRPRRNPPRGAQYGAPAEPASAQEGQQSQQSQQSQQGATDTEKCALLGRTPGYSPPARPEDDDSNASSR
jgi:hypothetical protein